MPYSLTPKQKAECKVIISLLAIAMLMKAIDEQLNREGPNPAVDNCTQFMDTILEAKDEELRKAMIDKINTARIKLTKKTKLIDTSSSLTGAIRLFTSGFIKTKPGTHLDYIRGIFAKNLEQIEKRATFNEERAKVFERELKKVIKTV